MLDGIESAVRGRCPEIAAVKHVPATLSLLLASLSLAVAAQTALPPVDAGAPAVTESRPADLRPLDARLLDAREALRKRDRARLAAARDELVAARHPLAAWADYWELNLRLAEASPIDLEAFYARWPGS